MDVNHLWLQARGLHLDFTATLPAPDGSAALASPSVASGAIDDCPVLAQHAEPEALVSTKSVLPLHGVLAGNPGHSVGKEPVGEPSLSGEPECLSLQGLILSEQSKAGNFLERRGGIPPTAEPVGILPQRS